MRYFRNRFVARIFLTSFVGVHVPLLCGGAYVLMQAQAIDWRLLTIMTAATLAGTIGTILFLRRELRPVVDITRSLHEFAEKRVRRPIAHRSFDEIGQLADAAQWAIDTVDCLLRKLEHEARTDYLTGLPNRRAFLREVSDRNPAMLALIDIDHFKSINDTFGHDMGDETLCEVADILTECFAPADIISRWGGEEFIVFFDSATMDAAREALETARQAVAATEIIEDTTVTFSAGLVAMTGDIDADVAVADKLLYQAKSEGRDRIMTPDEAIAANAGELRRLAGASELQVSRSRMGST